MSQVITRGPAPAAPAPARRRWYADPLWQLMVVACGYIVYSLSVGAVQWAGATGSRQAAALHNAIHVVDFEKLLGIFHESALQQALAGNDALMQFFNAVYMWAHLPLIIVLAVWLYLRHREHFRPTRNAVLISGAIALIVFQIVPVAPPRLLPGFGFIDTAAKVSGIYDTVEPKVFFNPYAAVPSMHVGWVLLMGLALRRYAGSRAVRWLGLALPAFMALAVIVTGNHYFFDVLAGVATALVGLWLAEFAEAHIYRGRHTRERAALHPSPPRSETGLARHGGCAVYKRILIPLDGSEASEQIVPHAIGLAKCFGSTLVLLHAVNARVQVVQATTVPEPVAAVPIATELADEAVRAEASASDAYLRRIKAQADAAGVACEAAIVEGAAADIVLHAVKQYEIDLVAMTTQGRSTLGRLFHGSTAESILEQLTIPMLVLHAEETKGG